MTLSGAVMGSKDANVTFELGLDIDVQGDEVHLCNDGKRVRLLKTSKREAEDGDLDRIHVGYEIRRADFLPADECSPSELENKSFGVDLIGHSSHDSYDGKHERVVENENVDDDILNQAIEFLDASAEPRDVLRILAELSDYPEGLRGTLERNPPA